MIAVGTYVMIIDLLAGLPLWWYNSTVIVFGIAGIGLLLLVREGFAAFNNITNYGINPETEDESEPPNNDTLEGTED